VVVVEDGGRWCGERVDWLENRIGELVYRLKLKTKIRVRGGPV